MLRGAEDNDKVYGGRGNDEINAAQFDTGSEDFSFGGRGNDTIRAKDVRKDIIDCGESNNHTDTVFYDVGLDTIKNCEIKNPTP